MNSDTRHEKLIKRRQGYEESLSTIEAAMVAALKATTRLRDDPFVEEAKKNIDKAYDRLRDAQRALVVEIYDTDKELKALGETVEK